MYLYEFGNKKFFFRKKEYNIEEVSGMIIAQKKMNKHKCK